MTLYSHYSEVPPEDWPWPDFTPQEMACRGTGMIGFHPGFMTGLQTLRSLLDSPMTVTSACRSAAHNRRVGGHSKSLHVCDEPLHAGQQGTLAVDIATVDGAYRGRLFALAWQQGWSIGWNAPGRFLHLDLRGEISLPQTTFDY
ncbi:MAG: D-Ala-D-Ala carboxypeptidase family metallohydrolase [Alphaproteobacteria bacterium]